MLSASRLITKHTYRPTSLGLCTLVVIAALGGTSTSSASAAMNDEIVLIPEWADASRTRAILRTATEDDVNRESPSAITTNYDNSSTPTDNPPGRSVPVRSIRVGGAEVGDDMQLMGNTGGRLSKMNYSFGNLNPTDALFQLTITYRWYNESRTLLQTAILVLSLPPGGLPGGRFVRVVEPEGFWSFLNLSLPDRVFITQQFSDTVGIPTGDMGQDLAGPRNFGGSDRFYYDFTANQAIDSGADDVNLRWLVRTEVIPSPTSLLILAATSFAFSVTRSRRA